MRSPQPFVAVQQRNIPHRTGYVASEKFTRRIQTEPPVWIVREDAKSCESTQDSVQSFRMSAHFFSQFHDVSGTLSEAISQAELRRDVYDLCAPKSQDELLQQSCSSPAAVLQLRMP